MPIPHSLTSADRDRLIDLVKNSRSLPKEDLNKLTDDEEDVFVFCQAEKVPDHG